MAFEFRPDESVNKGVRRIVRAQLKKAQQELECMAGSRKRGDDDEDDPVHSVRKRFKRLRAVCRLVRDCLGEKTYRQLNYRFRDAGRPLTEVRDSEVLLQTLDKLVAESGGRLSADAVAPMRRGLEANRDAIRRRVLTEAGTICDVAKTVETARSDLDDWRIAHGGWSAIRPGLHRSYVQCQKACAAAADAADKQLDEHLHEWRKRAKYFWHELQLVTPAKTDVLEPMANAVHELTKQLGDDHDLAVLNQMLADNPAAYGGETSIAVVSPLIVPRRSELQKQSFALQRQLFAEEPKAFLDRLRSYWKSWRTAGKFVRSV